MTTEQREKYDRNLNTLKSVFEEIGLEIKETLGDSEDCNGWACAKSVDFSATAYTGYCYSLTISFDSTEKFRDGFCKIVNSLKNK